jgi:hypothetical protein
MMLGMYDQQYKKIGRDIFMGHSWILTLDTWARTSNIKQSVMGVAEVFDHSESV